MEVYTVKVEYTANQVQDQDYSANQLKALHTAIRRTANQPQHMDRRVSVSHIQLRPSAATSPPTIHRRRPTQAQIHSLLVHTCIILHQK